MKKSRTNKHKKNKRFTNKLQCSPFAKKNKVVIGSCFTKNTLSQLRDSYNKRFPQESISSRLPFSQLWSTLHKKMQRISSCEQESCWIQELSTDDVEKRKLKALLFVPPQPSEWQKDPNAWLSNFDILKVIHQYETTYPYFYFMGPSMIDYDTISNKKDCVCNSLCRFSLKNEIDKKITKIGVIFNLDPHYKGGSHWTSLFIDIEDQFILYFNSTGEHIHPQINKFKDEVVTQGKALSLPFEFYENKMEHQQSDTECGMYSLYFIITMLLREKKTGKKMSKEEVIDYFRGKSQGRIKDQKMEELRNEYFSPNHSI